MFLNHDPQPCCLKLFPFTCLIFGWGLHLLQNPQASPSHPGSQRFFSPLPPTGEPFRWKWWCQPQPEQSGTQGGLCGPGKSTGLGKQIWIPRPVSCETSLYSSFYPHPWDSNLTSWGCWRINETISCLANAVFHQILDAMASKIHFHVPFRKKRICW